MVLLHKNSGDEKGFKYLTSGLEYMEGNADVSFVWLSLTLMN
jgi:hypothetical protein